MECGGKIKNMEELEFAIFCIESVAEKLGADGRRVYDALTKKRDTLWVYCSGI